MAHLYSSFHGSTTYFQSTYSNVVADVNLACSLTRKSRRENRKNGLGQTNKQTDRKTKPGSDKHNTHLSIAHLLPHTHAQANHGAPADTVFTTHGSDSQLITHWCFIFVRKLVVGRLDFAFCIFSVHA